jgi:hypothetical protein
MTETSCVVYRPKEYATSEVELSVELSTLANIYALALQKYRYKHEATHPGSPDDGTKIKEDSANEHRST